ncbi:MAG: hypothetical protein AAF235_09340, partial [Planctomycetota bacterium]
VYVNVSVGTLAFLGTMPLWRTASDRYREHVDEFFRLMHTPVDFEREVGAANDADQLRVIGVFAMLIGGFIGLLMLLPANDLAGRLSILFVGGTVGLVGGVLYFVGRRQKRADAEADDPAADSGSDTSDSLGD